MTAPIYDSAYMYFPISPVLILLLSWLMLVLCFFQFF